MQYISNLMPMGAAPRGIAIDASGNVYTANVNNNTVSKITSAGSVTQAWATLASGAGTHDIAIDASGNVYTVNANNSTVSKITPAGAVTQAWATLASGATPLGIAIDALGNVYTANVNNNTVSKITPAGSVTQAWAATGAGPTGMAIDASGNVYTANQTTNTVSKITPAGSVTQAWAALASGAAPTGIAIDASGNVYTENQGNNTVSKISPAGSVTQTWAALASGAAPIGIATDASGNVYTANRGNSTVSKISPAGSVTQAWAATGAGTWGIAIDASGNVYTANNNDNTVSKIASGCSTCPTFSAAPANVSITNSTCNSSCEVTGGSISAPTGTPCPVGSTLQYNVNNTGWTSTLPTYAQTGPAQSIQTRCNCNTDNTMSSPASTAVVTMPGDCGSSIGTVTQVWVALPPSQSIFMSGPQDIAIDASGNVYTPNFQNHTISKMNPAGVNIQNWTIQEKIPARIAIDASGNVYTANWGAPSTISKISAAGVLTEVWATLAMGAAPLGIVIDASGNVYTVNFYDAQNYYTVSKITPGGSVTQAWATLVGAQPIGIVIDASGNVYTANFSPSTVSKITPAGGVTQAWATLVGAFYPTDIAIDASGNVYTANNSAPNTVSKITPAGSVTESWATLAQVQPDDIAIDASGNVYTANVLNNTVSKITPAGVVTHAWATLAVRAPAIAIDASGNVYTANGAHNTVSKIAPGCSTCPTFSAAPANVSIANSSCNSSCVVAGGSITAPTGTPCPAGSTLQYNVNNTGWTSTLPTYAQTGPAQSIKTRCSCDSDANNVSAESNAVSTIPGTLANPVVPANGAATVACPSAATTPTPPTVTACDGSAITPTGPVIVNSPNPITCEGTRTYTYTYTCGSTPSTWSFVYTIERNPFAVPANGAATVSCPANATAPTPPAVLSACGETLTPTGPVVSNSPNPLTCEGTRTYTYTYTDCEGNAATWSFTYTIERNPFTVPANGAATVSNLNLATQPVPPVVTSSCGETLTPTGPVVTNTPNPLVCAGTRAYTWTYTDCEGNARSWSFVYTIADNTPPTVQCINQTLNFNGQQSLPLNTADLVQASDNCGIQSIGLSTSTISISQVGQTVPVTVTVTDISGNTSTCISSISVSGLPAGWSQDSDGIGCASGNDVGYTGGVFTVNSAGCYSAPPFTTDEAGFAQRTLCGNGSIIAQVTSVNGIGWAGVAIRESDAPGARKVQLLTNLSAFSRREVRYTTGGQAYPQQFASQSKYWLRILRQGSQFVGYVSANGSSWSQVFALTINGLPNCIQTGLVVTNGQANGAVSATFANVSVTTNANLSGIETEELGIEVVDLNLNVFPNPTSGEVTVDFTPWAGQPAVLEVYNQQGRRVRRLELDEAEGLLPVDLSDMPRGMYLFRVGELVQKVIIQ